jgi:hypothetical protein
MTDRSITIDDLWRPIKEAPKDGTRIIAAPTLNGHSCEAYWTPMYGGVWYHAGVGHLNGMWKPTHWMPMPSLPKKNYD